MSPVWCQPCARGLRGGLRVAVVAAHHQRAADDDLAALAAGQQGAVLVHDRDRHQRRRPPGRGQPLGGDRCRRRRKWSRGAIVEIIIGASVWPNSCAMTGPIRRQRLLEPGRRHRRGAVPEALQRRQVRAVERSGAPSTM